MRFPLPLSSLALTLVLSSAAVLFVGCSSTAARTSYQGLETTELKAAVSQVKRVAIPTDGQDLPAALGREMEKRGLQVLRLPPPGGRPQDRWPDAGAPIDSAALQQARAQHQADALLDVRSSLGYDGLPLLAQVRLLATPQGASSGRMLSEVHWRNRSMGNGPGSTLDRLTRQDLDAAAEEIVPLLLGSPPPPVR